MPIDFSSPFTERTLRVVNAAKLLRSAGRKKADRFLAEGENSVEAAVATGAATDLFVTEKAAERFEAIVTAAGHMGFLFIRLLIVLQRACQTPCPLQGFLQFVYQYCGVLEKR